MQTHEEALAMANYYQRKPAILHGKEIHIYLSKELMAIEVRMLLLRVERRYVNQPICSINLICFINKEKWKVGQRN